jgi:hypothetical protein
MIHHHNHDDEDPYIFTHMPLGCNFAFYNIVTTILYTTTSNIYIYIYIYIYTLVGN